MKENVLPKKQLALMKKKKKFDEEAAHKKQVQDQQIVAQALKEKEQIAGGQSFTYKQLVEFRAEALRNPKAANSSNVVDLSKLETYLTDSEFIKVFGADRISFAKFQEWKKVALKKKVQLW